MFGKAFVLVAAVCFIQAVSCDSIADLIKELKPQIEEATARVANVSAEGIQKYKAAFSTIQTELNELHKDIRNARIELLKTVAEAEQKAQEAGQDITACVKQVLASVKDLVAWKFEKCRFSPELVDLSLELFNLEKQIVILLAAPVKCTIQSGKDLDKLKACVLDAIDVAKQEADKVEADIEPAISQAIPNAKKCGAESAAEIEDKVKSVTEEFNDCVSKA